MDLYSLYFIICYPISLFSKIREKMARLRGDLMTSKNKLLEIQNLNKHYDGTKALSDISF